MLFVVISKMFGLRRYSTLFNYGLLAAPFGSYILNVDVVGKLYYMEALREHKQIAGKGLTCTGAHCFGGSFTRLENSTKGMCIRTLTRRYGSTNRNGVLSVR